MYTYVLMCKPLTIIIIILLILKIIKINNVNDKIIDIKLLVQVNKTKYGPELIVFYAFTNQGGPVDMTLNNGNKSRRRKCLFSNGPIKSESKECENEIPSNNMLIICEKVYILLKFIIFNPFNEN